MSSTSQQWRKTVCPLDCPDSCGILAKVVDGRVTELRGDPDHPFTHGFICRKMRAYPARLHSPDRLLYPMRRVGAKGEGRFVRIDWDEALSIFAEQWQSRRQQYGGESVLPFQYAGNMGVVNRNAGYALYHKLGSSRLLETICSAAAGAAWALHRGNMPGCPPENAVEADLIVAWGINVKVTNIHFWQYISAARRRGAKLLVIDPYRNATGQSADHYLQIEPGGDSALALGALKALLAIDGLDRHMLAERTTGFAALEDYLNETPWTEFTRLSGLTQEQIEDFAALLAAHPKTFIRIGFGLSRNSRGGMSVRAILALAAAIGLFPGGSGQGVLLSSKAFLGDTDVLRYPQLAEQTSRQINMAHLGQALTALDPAIRMFVVYNANPLVVAPDAGLVRQGLAREDLFTVVHEQVMTPTARYADLLLPATTFLENRDLYTGYGHFYLGVVDRVIEPLGEARSNFDLFQALAGKMGYTDAPFGQAVDERIADYLLTMEGLPADSGEAIDRGEWVASTRQAAADRDERPFPFVVAGKPGVPATATLTEAGEFSEYDLAGRYPFKLITPPHPDLLNSTFGERYPDRCGEVKIHPVDAKEQGIADGAEVLLANHRGRARRIARLTADTRQGLLVAEGLYWQEGAEGLTINNLTSQKTTDLADGPTFHESLVRIEVVRVVAPGE